MNAAALLSASARGQASAWPRSQTSAAARPRASARGQASAWPRPQRPKRVLVTGGAGFISSNFIRYLLEATPHEVVSLDALTYAGNLENLAEIMSHERLSFVQGDIRDAATVEGIVREVDVIVHA